VRLIDTNTLPAVSWKNGGGTTRTLAVSPEGAGFDDFRWRVSIADVGKSGSFSAFPGVDRTIMLLEGKGMVLHCGDGSRVALTQPFRPHSMAGDEPVDAELVNGSARDFNVMVRRGRARAAVQVWESEGSAAYSGDALFYCPSGVFQVGPALLPAGWACFVAAGREELAVAPKAPASVLIGVLLEIPEGGKRCTE
jgi:uncharacterized protein